MKGRMALSKDITALLAVTFLFFSSFNLLLSTFPVYISGLGFSQQIVGLFGGMFAFAAVLQRPFLARLTDSWGRRAVLFVSAAATLIGPILYMMSDDLVFLGGARILHAVSLAAFVVASQTLMADLAPEKQRGSLMGLYVVITGLPAVMFPPLGFYLLDNVGTAWLFAAASLLGLLMVPAIAIISEPNRDEESGLVASSGTVTGLLRNVNVLVAAAGIISVTMVFGAIITFLPLYGRSLGILNVGVYFTAFALAFMSGSAISGRLGDLYSKRALVFPAFVLVALGIAVLLLLRSLLGLLISAVITGLGFAALQTLLLVFTVDSVSLRQRAQAIGFFNNAFDLGVSVGGIALGVVAAYSYDVLWLILMGLALLGLLVCIRWLREPEEIASAE